MVQQIQKQGSPLGRLGAGLGQSLAETIPKEVDRYRLSQGLKSVADNPNLSPLQQYTQLAGVPGITPSMLQQLPEILKQQNLRNRYGQKGQNGRGDQPQQQQPSRLNREVASANLDQGQPRQRQPEQSNMPSDFQNETVEAKSQPGIVTQNPTSEELLTKGPWSPQRRDDRIGYYMDQGFQFDEAKQNASDDEARELALPEAAQKRRKELQTTQQEANKEFDEQLSTILEKEGEDIYGDIPGKLLLNAKKAMANDLATDPNLTEKTAAEKWIKKLGNYATAKSELRAQAHRDWWDRHAPGKKEEQLKRLKSFANLAEEMGSQQEFYDILRTQNNAESGAYGFDLSPGAAAIIAYPRSESVKNLIKSNDNWGKLPVGQLEAKSRKFANEVTKNRQDGDSFLAIAREMKDKNPFFIESAFFDQLRENQNKSGFNPRQKKELLNGVSDVFPNWGDIALFPHFNKSVAHD